MLQQESPEDFVLATGETHPVREFVEKAFAVLGYSIKWRGSGVAEEGYDEKSGRVLVKVDEKYFRPAEVECVGSPSPFIVLLYACSITDEVALHAACCSASRQKRRSCSGGSGRSTSTRS